MKKLLRAALVFGMAACASSNEGGNPSAQPPSYRKPKSGAKVYFAKNGWDIKSEKDIPAGFGKVTKPGGVIVWDLEGAVLDGKNQKGSLSGDNESNEPLFRARVPLVVKNGFARNVKNAMSFFAKDSGVERITFTEIGEDAVATAKGRSSSTRAYNFRVIDSEFINTQGNDKSIQLNEAKDAVVKGNTVFSGTTCMRIGDSDTTSVSDTATVTGNKWIGCSTAIHASKITVKLSGNKFEKVDLEWKPSNGAVKK